MLVLGFFRVGCPHIPSHSQLWAHISWTLSSLSLGSQSQVRDWSSCGCLCSLLFSVRTGDGQSWRQQLVSRAYAVPLCPGHHQLPGVLPYFPILNTDLNTVGRKEEGSTQGFIGTNSSHYKSSTNPQRLFPALSCSRVPPLLDMGPWWRCTMTWSILFSCPSQSHCSVSQEFLEASNPLSSLLLILGCG